MLPDMGHVDGDEALIVVAHDISPADMLLRLRGGRFAAFVTDLGGPIPYRHRGPQHGRAGGGGPGQCARAGARWRHADHRRRVGRRGSESSPRILQEYRRRQSAYADERAELSLLRDVPSVTLDGIDVVLHANIELPEEAALALASGAHGIGLFRSEFLFMGRADLPERRAVRSLCLGGEGNGGPSRHHPHAGHRRGQDAGRRGHGGHQPRAGPARHPLLPGAPEMFATQLRAILRASATGRCGC